MARVELPQSRLRARKRARLGRAAIIALAALIIAAVGLVALARAPFLKITSIEVSGAQTISTSSVEALSWGELAGDYLWIIPKDNIFLYPNGTLQGLIVHDYPQFKSVDVHAQDFHTVAVTIVERQPAALWCQSESTTTPMGQVPAGCYLMDEDGMVYASSPSAGQGSWVSYGGGEPGAMPWQYLSADSFHSLVALVGALSQTEATDTVRQVVVDPDGDVRAYFQNDFLLMFNLAEEGGDVFERFTLALKSDPFKGKTLADFEYLDMRFGDKLYYKLKTP